VSGWCCVLHISEQICLTPAKQNWSRHLECRVVHCCSLIPAYAETLLSSVAELCSQLADHYSEIPPITPELLPTDLVDEIPAHLSRNMPGVVTGDCDQHPIPAAR
jgi:hypothetical protein